MPKLQRFHHRRQRSPFKTALIVIGAVVLIATLGIFGFRLFRNWQQRRLSAQANALVDRGDYKDASLGARRILQINPESAEGARVMARIAERVGSRAAVDWRQRVVALGRAKPEDLYALALAGIRFGNLSVAQSALDKLPPSAKNTGEYHATAADLALARGDGAAVERELSEALRLDPDNKNYAFHLASVRLGASDAGLRAKGREVLVSLQNDKDFGRGALHQLIRDALQRADFDAALRLAHQLDNFPGRDFRDRLTVLTALRETKDAGFTKLLAELQAAAVQDADQAGGLIIWMNTHGMPAEAIAWSKTLPPELRSQRAMPIALADGYISVRDWDGLRRLVKDGNWGETDFLRIALYSRALREQGKTAEFTAQWNSAVKKVTPNAEAIMMLSQTAAKWGWREEAINLLWLASKDSVRGDEALHTLYDYFSQKGETQNLYRVLLHLEELQPENRDVQNNLAQVSLLLNLNADHGQKLAHDLYEKEPRNPTYVSTYAFALYVRGEAPRAVKLFKELSEAQLREPTIAAYYGIILAAVGDRDRAAEFLAIGEKASLLPEEKALVEKARRSLAQG